MPRDGWNGRRVTNAIAHVVNRDHGICTLCGHTGANSLDHIQPAADAPHLEWEPTNWTAVHHHSAGEPRGCQHPGCYCPGNIGRRRAPLHVVIAATRTINCTCPCTCGARDQLNQITNHHAPRITDTEPNASRDW